MDKSMCRTDIDRLDIQDDVSSKNHDIFIFKTHIWERRTEDGYGSKSVGGLPPPTSFHLSLI